MLGHLDLDLGMICYFCFYNGNHIGFLHYYIGTKI